MPRREETALGGQGTASLESTHFSPGSEPLTATGSVYAA